MTAKRLIASAAKSAATQPLLVSVIVTIMALGGQTWVSRAGERRALTIELQSATLIPDSANAPPGLAVQFRGAQVAGIVQLSFALVNTGRKTVLGSEIVTHPTVAIDSGHILSAEIGERVPSALVASLSVDSSRQQVAILTPLLNPGERLQVIIIAEATRVPRLTTRVHGAGIALLPLVDQRPATIARRRWLSPNVFAFAIGEFALLVVFAATMMQIGEERRSRKFWKGGGTQLRPPVAPFEFLSRVTSLYPSHPQLIHVLESQLAGSDPTQPMRDDLFISLKAVVTDFADRLRRALRWIAIINVASLAVGALYFIWVTR